MGEGPWSSFALGGGMDVGLVTNFYQKGAAIVYACGNGKKGRGQCMVIQIYTGQQWEGLKRGKGGGEEEEEEEQRGRPMVKRERTRVVCR
jgi:hypothetical protein